jgi:deferrochelatase/peroxidase EfeB
MSAGLEWRPGLWRAALLVCAMGAGAGAAQAVLPMEPFWGEHQAGIASPIQHHTFFASFDLVTAKRDDVVKLLKAWTAAAARMTAGETAQPLELGLKLAVAPAGDAADAGPRAADSGEALDMSPSRLTITFGFGAGLFVKDGKDRFGLAARRPEALVDMPKFAGDQLVEGRTGGDLSVQACADDPQVVFHAVRQLARIAEGVAQIRWTQTGFRPYSGARHLLGFTTEGMENPSVKDPKAMAKGVWSGAAGPEWMRGGSYLAVRRIRFAVEHWDHMSAAFQEQAIGESKFPGGLAKPGKPVVSDLKAADSDDLSDHPPSHLQTVGGDAMSMYRRSYSFTDGVNFTSERWPPWRQGLEYDAGMLFICYQPDPRTGFINTYTKMSKLDFLLNQFWTHEGSGLFACPQGVNPGEYIGQGLFESR